MAQVTIAGTYTAGQPARASDVSGDLSALATRVNEVTTEQIKDANVTEGKLANSAVTTAKIANGALSADTSGRAKVADGFLSADATGRAKMADGFVNNDKLDSDTQTKLTMVARAWAKIDGTDTPASVTDHVNVDSVTDNGTGDYTVTWDTDFANADYAVAVICLHTAVSRIGVISSGTQAVGSVTIFTGNPNGPSKSDQEFTIIAFGDQ